MPLANSYNVTGTANEQPEYQMLWEPYAVYGASTITATTIPAAAGAGAWVPGAALQFGASGSSITAAGTNWPTGTNVTPTGDDYGGVTGPYTIQAVDIAAVSTTTFIAGVLLGVSSLGLAPPPVASGQTTINPGGRLPQQVAMVGKRGVCQILCDSTTTVGHTFATSSTSAHTGQFTDSGGSTRTYGTHYGIILQAVTVSTGPLLVWAYVNFP